MGLEAGIGVEKVSDFLSSGVIIMIKSLKHASHVVVTITGTNITYLTWDILSTDTHNVVKRLLVERYDPTSIITGVRKKI